MSVSITFNLNEGFDQLNELAKGIFGSASDISIMVVFEVGNLSSYDMKRTNSDLVPADWINTLDGMPLDLPSGEGIIGAYSLSTAHDAYAMRNAFAFASNKNNSFLFGCFLNANDSAQRWAGIFQNPHLDVRNLAQVDMGMFIGTAPGSDKWPKAGEIIPGWKGGAGATEETSTRGDWMKISRGGAEIGIAVAMDASPDAKKFAVRVFIYDRGSYPKSLPGESYPIEN